MNSHSMNFHRWWSRWIVDGDLESVEGWRATFGAGWAQESPAILLLLILAAMGLSIYFYWRWQPVKSSRATWFLVGLRGFALSLLLLVLADPLLELTLVRYPEPQLWVGLDASDSLQIADELPSSIRAEYDRATGLTSVGGESHSLPTRADYIRAFLSTKEQAWLKQLRQRFQVSLFTISSEKGVEPLTVHDDDGRSEDNLDRWNPHGRVTAIGDSIDELARRQSGGALAGLVLISDFDQNFGVDPQEVVRRLGAPVYTIGVGPESAVDVSIDLLAPPTMKQAETATITVTVRQRELDQTPVQIRVWAEPVGSDSAPRFEIGERTLTLSGSTVTADMEFTPTTTGRYVFVAEVEAVAGETVTQNNQSRRDVKIIDDFLRLLYIEYEPTWEWRFVKEVFHRDKLVGTRGFRTFLRSADPVVRETNELFVSNLTLPRSQFFESDVIFLGDLPASALSTRFGEMTREFVDQFGGGLVVMAGPRFGPGQLAETPLADMLPVVVDPGLRRRDDRSFSLNLTSFATQYDFMKLGRNEETALQPWANLGKLPWYQPVQRIDPRATVLAEHPTDVLSDGRTKQPLIAIRPYGRGEVVYLGFNEMWRLRRLHGEEYYRQFWGQLIHRLGLSHALGDQKRFVVRTDRRQYGSGDEVIVTVEAYDEDFQPLTDAELVDHALRGEWLRPTANEQGQRSDLLKLQQLRPGIFETRVRAGSDGEHRLTVNDPVTQAEVELVVAVSDISIERRNPVRNVTLQKALARETGGRSYDLTTAENFLKDFQPPQLKESAVEIIPLWNTWLTFFLMTGLLFAEWIVRKRVHLP